LRSDKARRFIRRALFISIIGATYLIGTADPDEDRPCGVATPARLDKRSTRRDFMTSTHALVAMVADFATDIAIDGDFPVRPDLATQDACKIRLGGSFRLPAGGANRTERHSRG
jgi:hypothetical protein